MKKKVAVVGGTRGAFAVLAVFSLAIPAWSCAEEVNGINLAESGGGPKVIWDLAARPLPDIPFPNDLATRLDNSSPTGLRLNLSLIAPIGMEEEVRERANRLDGFGTYAPITVSFDSPIDLDDLRSRHVENHDFADDAVYVIDVTPTSPTFGQPAMLDLGRGHHPLVLKVTDAYFPNDPRESGNNLVFESVQEESGEDTDFDGVADEPNVHPAGGHPWNDLLTHYEKQTNTLLVRPVAPLRERTRYAVVVTRRVHGTTGSGRPCSNDAGCPQSGSCDSANKKCREAVRSPFFWANHAHQSEALEPLEGILAEGKLGIETDDVAFAWTFTTQSITADLVAIRNGLYGSGPLARLADEFPPTYSLTVAKTAERAEQTGSAYVVSIDEMMEIAGPMLPSLSGVIPSLAESADVLIETYASVDYLIAGTFRSPNFLVDRDGHASPGHPADDDEIFEMNAETGEAVYGSSAVPFVCIVPKERADYHDPDFPHHTGKQPFPVAIFMHGTASSKLQALGFAGQFGRLGIATCAIDAFGHGMPFPALPVDGGFMSEENVIKLIEAFAPGYTPVYDILKGTRVRDINMDGNLDPAGDFWTMDPFHTRDCIRQSVVDLMQFLRILRSMDGEQIAEGRDGGPLLGDFDGDGAVDLGGPDNRYFAYGISLGGIVTAVFAGVDPALDAATVVAAGGGLSDVAIRSTNPGVPEMAIMPALGPVIIGDADEDTGELVMRFVMPVFDHTDLLEIARLSEATPGRTVRLTNLDSGATRHAVVRSGAGLRLQIPADAMRATELRHYTGFDPMVRLGGEECENDAGCEQGLKCNASACGCQKSEHCPEGWGCRTGKCMMLPQPIDSTLETQAHPALGDRFLLEVLEKDKVVESVDVFESDVTVSGVVYPEGAPLVNLYRGFGNARQTPEFRRFMTVAQTVLEPGDPVNWARHYALEPIAYPESDPDAIPGTNTIVLNGVGDTNVPVATGIAIARAAGIVGFVEADGRYGEKSEMDVLIEHGVVEGVYNRCRYAVEVADAQGAAAEECILFDPDDLDGSRLAGKCSSCAYTYEDGEEKPTGWVCSAADGEACGDGFGAPSDLTEPVRATMVVGGDGAPEQARLAHCSSHNPDGTCRVFKSPSGVQALRFALTKPVGFHGIYLMAPYKPFDIETYQLNLMARYFVSSGTELWDDLCLEDNSCSWEPPPFDSP